MKKYVFFVTVRNPNIETKQYLREKLLIRQSNEPEYLRNQLLENVNPKQRDTVIGVLHR